MELILWRHAEALPARLGEDDALRELSAKGVRQAKAMAAWLAPRLGKNYRLLASPTRRTRETAARLSLLRKGFASSRRDLLRFADEDARSFDLVMSAYRLPKATAEEKAAAAPRALAASRTNLLLSIGMLYCMSAANALVG